VYVDVADSDGGRVRGTGLRWGVMRAKSSVHRRCRAELTTSWSTLRAVRQRGGKTRDDHPNSVPRPKQAIIDGVQKEAATGH